MERDLYPGVALWRSIIARSKESKIFVVGLIGVCIAVPWAVAEGFMWGAKQNQAKLKEELRHAPFNMTEEVTSANKERIEQLFDDIKYKRNLNERYLSGRETSIHNVQEDRPSRTIASKEKNP